MTTQDQDAAECGCRSHAKGITICNGPTDPASEAYRRAAGRWPVTTPEIPGAAAAAAAAVRADRGPLPAYIPGVGDRVRIVLEGEVVAAFNAESMFAVEGPDRRQNIIDPSAAHVVSVEKLPDPEQAWETGDVVLDAAAVVYRYEGSTGGYWTRPGTAAPFSTTFPKRPLRLLVRGGESVAAGGGNG